MTKNSKRIVPNPTIFLFLDLENQKDNEDEEEEIGGGDLDFPSLIGEEDDSNSKLSQVLLYLQLQELLFKTEPKTEQPQDLKKKGIDKSCSLETIPKKNYPFRRRGAGECSTTDCVICNCSVPSGGVVKSNECNHAYCRDCFKNYLAEKIQEDITQVNCPESRCKVVLEPKFCRDFLPEEVFGRWMEALAELSVLAWPYLFRCPFELCEKLIVDDERGFMIRACPNCWGVFCVHCRVSWHMGKSCNHFQMEDRLRKSKRRRRRRYGGQKQKDVFME